MGVGATGVDGSGRGGHKGAAQQHAARGSDGGSEGESLRLLLLLELRAAAALLLVLLLWRGCSGLLCALRATLQCPKPSLMADGVELQGHHASSAQSRAKTRRAAQGSAALALAASWPAGSGDCLSPGPARRGQTATGLLTGPRPLPIPPRSWRPASSILVRPALAAGRCAIFGPCSCCSPLPWRRRRLPSAVVRIRLGRDGRDAIARLATRSFAFGCWPRGLVAGRSATLSSTVAQQRPTKPRRR